jgi:CRP/FNR family transcriptional regulator, cyclic AMP receptor protein
LIASSRELKGEKIMASPVIAARNTVPALQIWTNRPQKAGVPLSIPMVSRSACAELRGDSYSGLAEERLAALEKIEHATNFPEGAIIFMEGQPARGVYVVRQGRVKLLTTNSEGRTLILKIAKPGEALGLNSVITGKAYDVTAEILQPTELAFIPRADFLNFIAKNGDACLYFATLLSRDCRAAYDVARSIGLSQSVTERLAKFLLDWVSNGPVTKDALRATLALTHEEIAQLIGASRETVTRTLSEFKRQRTIELHGSTLILKNKVALESLVAA